MNRHIMVGLFFVNLLLAGVAFAAVNDATQGADGRRLEKATFAGGGFWGMEEALDKGDGVGSTTARHTRGKKKNPTYQDGSAGETRPPEAGEVLFYPAQGSYSK